MAVPDAFIANSELVGDFVMWLLEQLDIEIVTRV